MSFGTLELVQRLKDKKSQFGYRKYLVMDEQDGYVRSVDTAPANRTK